MSNIQSSLVLRQANISKDTIWLLRKPLQPKRQVPMHQARLQVEPQQLAALPMPHLQVTMLQALTTPPMLHLLATTLQALITPPMPHLQVTMLQVLTTPPMLHLQVTMLQALTTPHILPARATTQANLHLTTP